MRQCRFIQVWNRSMCAGEAAGIMQVHTSVGAEHMCKWALCRFIQVWTRSHGAGVPLSQICLSCAGSSKCGTRVLAASPMMPPPCGQQWRRRWRRHCIRGCLRVLTAYRGVDQLRRRCPRHCINRGCHRVTGAAGIGVPDTVDLGRDGDPDLPYPVPVPVCSGCEHGVRIDALRCARPCAM